VQCPGFDPYHSKNKKRKNEMIQYFKKMFKRKNLHSESYIKEKYLSKMKN
jgi:hypothetical protein